METQKEKTIIVISNQTFTLFKGLSQKDLSGKNPADRNRLNIRPMWSHGLDQDGKIQRFDFVQGDNECPEYIAEWESFQKMCDNGTLGIKGAYSRNAGSTISTTDLAKLRELEEENKKLKKALSEKEEPKTKDNIKATKVEEA